MPYAANPGPFAASGQRRPPYGGTVAPRLANSPPIRPSSGRGSASLCVSVPTHLVRSYRTISPLPFIGLATKGGVISVPLSVAPARLAPARRPRSIPEPIAPVKVWIVTESTLGCFSSGDCNAPPLPPPVGLAFPRQPSRRRRLLSCLRRARAMGSTTMRLPALW